MPSLAIALIAFACIFGATLLAVLIRPHLAPHQLSKESRDVIQHATGMLATLSAMVLGLLVASAKTSYDMVDNEFRETASKVVLLDRTLGRYGPDSANVRSAVKQAYAGIVDLIFADVPPTRASLTAPERADPVSEVQRQIAELAPRSDAQRAQQSQALDLASDLAKLHWLLVAQAGSAIPLPFLAVLVSWLAAIFASFGLFAPRNATALTALVIAAMAVSTAIFLIEELDRPLTGLLRISGAPMRNALERLGH
jgi:hypothetical protein